MSTSPWSPLLAELDRWSTAGRRLRLWLRDDDAIAPSPSLSRLSDLAERFDAPVLLAVIPMLAQKELAAALSALPGLVPCQHGCRHRNHAPQGAKKSEFGPERDVSIVTDEIRGALHRLRELFGDRLAPIFVPPWNRIDPIHAAGLPDLGFAGLSCFRGDRVEPGRAPARLDTHLDVMDWRHGRVGRPHPDLIAELTALIAEKRRNAVSSDTLGVLLHHRDHDETVWSFLEALLRLVGTHPAVAMADPRRLLAEIALLEAHAAGAGTPPIPPALG